MITSNICIIIWIAYMMLEGYREAFYYDAVSNNAKQKDLHPMFTIQRALVILCINLACMSIGIKLILLNLVLIALQPFFHNGMYYRTRNTLNPYFYPKRWLDQSTSSLAKSTKLETPTMRIVGVVLAAIAISLMLFI